jgi:hypothetical protein
MQRPGFGNEIQDAAVDRREQITLLPLAIPEEPMQGNALGFRDFPDSNIPVKVSFRVGAPDTWKLTPDT